MSLGMAWEECYGDYMTKCNAYVRNGTDWSCEVANGEECDAPC
jgi:hypothetical protein